MSFVMTGELLDDVMLENLQDGSSLQTPVVVEFAERPRSFVDVYASSMYATPEVRIRNDGCKLFAFIRQSSQDFVHLNYPILSN